MFKNMTLQTRLIGSFFFMGLIVLTMALLGWFTTNELNQYINILATDNIPSVSGIWKINEGQTQIQSAERLLFDPEVTVSERQGAITQIQDAWKQINEGIKQYEATPLSEQEKKEYGLVKEQLDAWKQAHEKLLDIEQQFTQLGIRNPWKKQIELIRQGKEKTSDFAIVQAPIELRNRMDSEGANREEPLFKITDDQAGKLLKLNEGYISDTQKEVEQNVARSIFWISVGIAIDPITAIIFGFIIARQIAFQILGVVRVAEQISTGNLTTQVTADSNSKDEMNRLLTAFQTMTQNLNTLIRQVQHSGIQVTTSATQIAVSGKQLEGTLTEQVASTNEVAAATKEISATSRELVSAMEQVAAISQITTTAANDSQKDIVRMETTMRQLAEATNAIAARLGVISEKANSINTKEISPASVIHTLPHRSNQILRGLVSIRGELRLCISLSDLLNLEAADTAVQSLSPVVYSRMVVLEKADKTWVFGVDELYGVHRFQRDELQDPPKSLTQTYTKGLFHWQPSGSQMEQSHSVSYLDDELLFTTLARKVV
ncbi:MULTISPECIES: MCP four helix bundle domain-containing protein [unclassified Nostoc]|nr:MCP four helix bundle domain-containing protein [Nostoc sp. JL34]MBN3883004.1 MCP four helix bundle domain-containing protein [Nostoc sp. JL34]